MYSSAFIMFFIPPDGYLFLKQCTVSFETKNLLNSFKGGPEGYEIFSVPSLVRKLELSSQQEELALMNSGLSVEPKVQKRGLWGNG